MSQYLVTIHLPDKFNPSAADEAAMGRDIDTLNEEMVAAGVRIFVGGLTPAREAKSLRAQPDGKVLTTDGPYLETKEQQGDGCGASRAVVSIAASGSGLSAPARRRCASENIMKNRTERRKLTDELGREHDLSKLRQVRHALSSGTNLVIPVFTGLPGDFELATSRHGGS